MIVIVATAATRLSREFVADTATDLLPTRGYISGMATPRIGRKSHAHIYLAEWLEYRGLSDEKAAGRLGIDRTTVWKWKTQPRRLTRDKIASLAAILDIEPEELYRPPGRPSLDAMIKDAPPEVQSMVFDVVRRMVNRG